MIASLVWITKNIYQIEYKRANHGVHIPGEIANKTELR